MPQPPEEWLITPMDTADYFPDAEVVANLLKESTDTTFVSLRIDRCPECDSDKIVFPKSGVRRRTNRWN
jgi:hypothetical protein